jgi:hypothetical protein
MLGLGDRLASEHLATGRFDSAANDTRIGASQSPCDADERATGADTGCPAIDTAAGAVEQLSAGAGLVRYFGLRGMELVHVEAAPLSSEFLRDARRGCNVRSGDPAWLARDLRHEDYLGAKRFEHASPLRAVASGHSDDKRMPEHSANDCEACTHITARHLNHRCTRLQPPVATRGLDDGSRGAVLYAATRLQELGLS